MPLKRVSTSQFTLFLGFGGLLALMAVAGFEAVHFLRQIQQKDDEIRRGFLSRNAALAEMRSDLYLSGTYVRDYLLDPDPNSAASHLANLNEMRVHMERHLRDYERLLRPEEVEPINGLKRELARYWEIMNPVLQWTPQDRRARGFAFLRDEILPRRAAMLTIADKVAAVNEQQLKAGGRRVADLFSDFRARLLLIVGITLGLGLLLAGFSIRNTLGLEKQAAARYREVAQAREELQELSARLLEAQENERRAISRELHDEVGQSLSAVLMELGNLSRLSRGQTDPLRDHVATIRGLIESCVAAVRNMALLLRPSMLDDLGLLPALQWQAREFSKRTGMIVNVADENVADDLPEEFKTCVYRIVQEALHNCSRHSQAKTVRVSVRQDSGTLSLAIQDDGRGFNHSREKGLGLLGMHERVEHLGGMFRIESEPGSGALIAISLPLAPAADREAGAVRA